MTLSQWKDTLKNNLVTIKRESDLILDLLTKANFASIEEATLVKIRAHLIDAMEKYVLVNSRAGCLNRRSIKFDPIATYQPTSSDRLCEEDYKFGGMEKRNQ